MYLMLVWNKLANGEISNSSSLDPNSRVSGKKTENERQEEIQEQQDHEYAQRLEQHQHNTLGAVG